VKLSAKVGRYFRFYHSIQAFGGFYPPNPPRISFSVGCLQAAADTFVII